MQMSLWNVFSIVFGFILYHTLLFWFLSIIIEKSVKKSLENIVINTHNIDNK